MASVARPPAEIEARVDREGRLIAAGPELAELQAEAGGRVGGPLELPQLAAIARLAFGLGVPIERPARLASAAADIHCWVRAIPGDGETLLNIADWSVEPARGPRFAAGPAEEQLAASVEDEGLRLDWASDSDLRMSEVAPRLAELLGLARDEAVGMPLTKLVRLREDHDGEMPLIAALAARTGFEGQRAQSRADARVELVLHGAPVRSEDGGFAGFRGGARAIGESAAPTPAAAAGATPETARVALLDSTLEDVLRVPIARILEEAEQIAQRGDGALRGDYAGYGADIVAAARHLLSVLSAMGDDPEFGRGRIELTALAAEAAVLVDPIAETRTVRVEIESSPPLAASGEEHAVIQILVNLLVNAIRHSPAGSLVSLRFGGDEQWASVTVSDQGVGIAPEDHKRIFERFERADEQPGGTGLGLAIARRLARSMGGDVLLDSAPGEGAHFTLRLPAG